MPVVDLVIWVSVAFVAICTFLPFSRVPHGFIRSTDFPRIQLLCMLVILLVPIQIFLTGTGKAGAFLLMLVCAAIHTAYIIRFTPLWPNQSARATDAELADGDRQISILASNVKKSNRDYDRLLALVTDTRPDILILIEVDDDWIAGVLPSLDAYPERVLRPLDNGYGLAVFSTLPFFDTEVRELLVRDVPSVRTGVTLRSGDVLRLYILHPEPPVPSQGTEGRDGEIGLVGLEVEEDTLPAIVTGDLNDVAWSSTTRRFQRLSGLLDPRVGRGFFNTYDSRFPVIRWPLDHLFHDARFRLIDMQRLRHIGSDHFPIFFRLALTPLAKAEETPPPATAEDVAEVEDMAEGERKSNREPIGADWEDETT